MVPPTTFGSSSMRPLRRGSGLAGFPSGAADDIRVELHASSSEGARARRIPVGRRRRYSGRAPCVLFGGGQGSPDSRRAPPTIFGSSSMRPLRRGPGLAGFPSGAADDIRVELHASSSEGARARRIPVGCRRRYSGRAPCVLFGGGQGSPDSRLPPEVSRPIFLSFLSKHEYRAPSGALSAQESRTAAGVLVGPAELARCGWAGADPSSRAPFEAGPQVPASHQGFGCREDCAQPAAEQSWTAAAVLVRPAELARSGWAGADPSSRAPLEAGHEVPGSYQGFRSRQDCVFEPPG